MAFFASSTDEAISSFETSEEIASVELTTKKVVASPSQ
jgi:hypothetical protein